MKKMFDSPLRSFLVDEKHCKVMIEKVFPSYLAFHALMDQMTIDRTKETDRLHTIEKRLKKGLSAEPEPEPEVEEVKEVPKFNPYASKSPVKHASMAHAQVTAPVEEEEDPRCFTKLEENEEEMEKYGVSRIQIFS
jgi:hypothetical protein